MYNTSMYTCCEKKKKILGNSFSQNGNKIYECSISINAKVMKRNHNNLFNKKNSCHQIKC